MFTMCFVTYVMPTNCMSETAINEGKRPKTRLTNHKGLISHHITLMALGVDIHTNIPKSQTKATRHENTFQATQMGKYCAASMHCNT